jgi:electron transfer flavoprotein beta subunit
MGPPAAGQIIKECLALGADRGFLLTDIAFAGADAYSTAFTLARGIKAIGEFDLILCGMASSDGSTEWVGPEMASFLDVPVVTMINEIVESGDRWWKVKAALENGYRLVEVQLPALFTVTRELNDPRTLSFSGIIKSRKKEITEWGREDVGLSESEVGLKGSPTIVSEMTTIESGRKVELLAGTSEEKADLLVEKLVEAGVL